MGNLQFWKAFDSRIYIYIRLADSLFWQLSIDHNIDVQYVCIISFPALPNWLESMRLNIDRDLVKQ